MKKTIKFLVFSLLMLFGFSLNVNAETLPAVDNGTITLNKNYTVDSIALASDVKVIDLNGKVLTLNGALKVSDEVIIKNGTVIRNSGNTSDALIEVTGTVNLNNVVIDGNKVVTSAPATYGYGVGVYVKSGASAVLDGVKLKNHYTGNNVQGGALYISEAESVVVKNSEIFDNKSEAGVHGLGAAIYALDTGYLELKNTKIYNNYSSNAANVDLYRILEFVFDKDSSVKNNESLAAAGMRIADSFATISGTFEGNKSTVDNGGGLYTMFNNNAFDYIINITSTAKFVNNTSALAGGALYVNSNKNNVPGTVVINGATFTGNSALGTVDASNGLFKDIGGGAIAVARGILEINDATVTDNKASVNKGNSIIVSHANGNYSGGDLTINGGTFDDSIDLGVGSITVNGGIFKYDMSKYIVDPTLISIELEDGFVVVENTVLFDENVTFENEEAMDVDYELVVTDKMNMLTDEKIVKNIENSILVKDKNAKDIEVLSLYDISVMNGANKVSMEDGKFRLTFELDEELLKYDSYSAIYVDDNGNVSYLPVELDGSYASFETTHLSTYGIVGYNSITNPETSVNLEVIICTVLFGLMFACIGVSLKKQETRA